MAEKDGDKEEETEIEEGALNVLCSSSYPPLFRHKVDEGSELCLSSMVFRRSDAYERDAKGQDRIERKGLKDFFF